MVSATVGILFSVNYQKLYEEYDKFIRNIDLSKYSNLRDIKTVEQDLPKDINPMKWLYKYYWLPNPKLIDYDKFFNVYWKDIKSMSAYRKFVQKYFWGCCEDFIEIGFKARIYRTWVSFLTQLHFMYLWNSIIDEKVEASAELDMKGVDGRVRIGSHCFDFQVFKISYRKEASERPGKKHRKRKCFIVEIPYIVEDIDELKKKLLSRRTKEDTKERIRRMVVFFKNYLHKYENGFVVFKRDYVERVYQILRSRPKNYRRDEIIDLLLTKCT